MLELFEINYLDVEKNKKCEDIIKIVIEECYKIENLLDSKLYINVILTTSKKIKEFNKQYRNIDKETDVLSFPMFQKNELGEKIKNREFINMDILGDMIISIERVEQQAKEYGHSFERELAYMVVHSFYHLIGYDHIDEKDKVIMRAKEEYILNRLNIKREN